MRVQSRERGSTM